MQGASAPASIINALSAIEAEQEKWDGVVIIRGGGATSDLQAYEDYNLAAAVAQFPLPIAIGIGHERDITVLDWVANMRLKTPTAVAEWLVSKAENVLGALILAGNKILQYATQQIAGNKEQLAQAQALLPVASQGVVERAKASMTRAIASLYGLPSGKIQPAEARLNMLFANLQTASANVVRRQGDRLEASAKLLEVLSPAATLKRGYSITRLNGHAISSVAAIPPGSSLEITLADGTIQAQTQK
jgi:exodeoxyribonuclease VII large subunit